ncbi:sulfurtransferase [Aquabacterium humicola]|uniref:sulfurtransferase n=1 Tax=Aquabacterium humicola TaxID=3237377 RepID=UPI002542F21C|nr:sulfurtransferase [Rubrivivax pictus]
MNPLISATDLKTLLQSGADVLVCDCSFDLANPAAGALAFAAGHIPGAVYLHLDDDLSAPKTGRNGRHPLPDRAGFAQRLASIGLREGTTVIACDAQGGAYASRLWWMLRWIGHAAVRVLDGGLPAWRAAGGAIETGPAAARPAGAVALKPSLVEAVDYAALRESLGSGRELIVDGRAADRFRGENETIDPVAGHIPGAANRPFRDNLAADGTFKPAAQLRAEWQAVMGGRAPGELVQHCGSGVTACHNLLAMEAAGLPGSKLYPGSWSEWIAQPGAPIAVGA